MEDKTIYLKNGSSITPIRNSEDMARSKTKHIEISGINKSPEDKIRLMGEVFGIKLYWYQRAYLKSLWKLRRKIND